MVEASRRRGKVLSLPKARVAGAPTEVDVVADDEGKSDPDARERASGTLTTVATTVAVSPRTTPSQLWDLKPFLAKQKGVEAPGIEAVEIIDDLDGYRCATICVDRERDSARGLAEVHASASIGAGGFDRRNVVVAAEQAITAIDDGRLGEAKLILVRTVLALLLGRA